MHPIGCLTTLTIPLKCRHLLIQNHAKPLTLMVGNLSGLLVCTEMLYSALGRYVCHEEFSCGLKVVNIVINGSIPAGNRSHELLTTAK